MMRLPEEPSLVPEIQQEGVQAVEMHPYGRIEESRRALGNSQRALEGVLSTTHCWRDIPDCT